MEVVAEQIRERHALDRVGDDREVAVSPDRLVEDAEVIAAGPEEIVPADAQPAVTAAGDGCERERQEMRQDRAEGLEPRLTERDGSVHRSGTIGARRASRSGSGPP